MALPSRIPGATKLRRAARALAQRVCPGAAILLYHRVAEADGDPWSLCVTPAHFAEHCEVLRGRVRRLAELADPSARAPRGRAEIAITFDDGYAQTLRTAEPMLARHALPATAFVTSGGVATGEAFWWDELEALILGPGRLPAALEVEVGGARRCFALAGAAPDDAATSAPGWAERGEVRSARERAFLALHRLLGGVGAPERAAALAALRAQAGTGRPSASDRVLDCDEIARLARQGLVEIGAHSVSHPRLPALPEAVQRSEVEQSRATLEAITGAPVASFAYPHGTHDGTTRRVVRDAGFARACSSSAGLLRPRSDRLRLPRFEVRDCDGDTFARRLRAICGA